MNKKIILAFILGVLASGTIVYALSASDIKYQEDKTVAQALNELYNGIINGPSTSGNGAIGSIVYLDPTNPDKTCNSYNSISTTGTKTGCMKWYIYDNAGDKYKLILDHNTTTNIAWNDSNVNVAYEQSNLKTEVDKLVSESKWVVTPRIISAEEVNKITGKTGWTSTSKWYCLESLVQDYSVLPFCNNTGRLGWLYDHTKCKDETNGYDWKCPTYDSLSVAYWTSTTYGTAGSGSHVWFVPGEGRLNHYNADNTNRGIRPVIEIEKAIVK